MTEREIKDLYRQIEGLNTDEIKATIERAICSNTCSRLDFSARRGFQDEASTEESIFTLETACMKAWDKKINLIQSYINKNPKSSKAIMDIVCLLAPTIAQQYTGFSGMAIVGTLTIMCKHNLGL